MFNTKGYKAVEIFTREEVLRRISQMEIFRHYIPSFERLKETFSSELRNDQTASCGITAMPSGRLIYRDFATGDTYTCFSYVEAKFGCDSRAAVNMIVRDLLSQNGEFKAPVPVEQRKTIKYSNEKVKIRIKSIPFTYRGLEYWMRYGINKKLLDLYSVKQISHVYIRGFWMEISKKEKYAFAYCFGNHDYKILRPNIQKDKPKWLCNNGTIIQGIDQIPETGKLLFITKSLKDIMTLKSIKRIAIAPQSERSKIPLDVIRSLKERFEKVILYYDNDVPGIEAAKNHSVLYRIGYIHNPLNELKDPSDFYRYKGKIQLRKLISKLLKKVNYDFCSG